MFVFLLESVFKGIQEGSQNNKVGWCTTLLKHNGVYDKPLLLLNAGKKHLLEDIDVMS